MTRDDIIRMAREAGIVGNFWPELERFAALVAAAERERAALKTEQLGMVGYGTLAIAAAIRKGQA